MTNLQPTQQKVNLEIKRFYMNFIPEGRAPFGVQRPGESWYIRKRPKWLTDNMLSGMLHDKQYWLGCYGGYYPKFGLIDMDAPEPGKVEKVIKALGLRQSQFKILSSPSYMMDGSCHIYFKPRINDKPPAQNMLTDILYPIVKTYNVESYPARRRIIRLPFGKDQGILDENGQPLNYSLSRSMDYLEKIDDWDISGIDFSPLLPFQKKANEKVLRTFNRKYLSELWREGLQSRGTRHDTLLQLSFLLYRDNITQDKAVSILFDWIRKNHNGYSQEINKGRLDVVKRDIQNIIAWTWERFSESSAYPDQTLNNEYAITREDIELIARTYPKKLSWQKRLFNFLKYWRPRESRDRVCIHRNRWFEIAGHHYMDFQRDLMKRGMLDKDPSYQVGINSKAFIFNPEGGLNKAKRNGQSSVFSSDNRNITSLKEVFATLPIEYLRNRLKLASTTLWRLFETKED